MIPDSREAVAGIDEAGRGPLAGPVVAAAVILHPARPLAGLDDSKRLSAGQRALLEREIREHALCWAVAEASVAEIDALNILQATLLAMRRAVSALTRTPALALVDGNRDPGLGLPTRTVVGGDRLHAEISAASILAKEARDRIMLGLAGAHPVYGFERHKGYPTRMHMAALGAHGPCEHHRRSFAPVRRCLEAATADRKV
jgi:ribonuclease HII